MKQPLHAVSSSAALFGVRLVDTNPNASDLGGVVEICGDSHRFLLFYVFFGIDPIT